MNAISQSRRLEMDVCARIDRCIAANEGASVSRGTRIVLDVYSDHLRKYRCNLSKLNADEAALYAGPNMKGPTIADLINSSTWLRENEAHVREVLAADERAITPTAEERSRLYAGLIERRVA